MKSKKSKLKFIELLSSATRDLVVEYFCWTTSGRSINGRRHLRSSVQFWIVPKGGNIALPIFFLIFGRHNIMFFWSGMYVRGLRLNNLDFLASSLD